MTKREKLGRIPESYLDFDKWLPVMHDPRKYWATPPINMIWAFKEAIRIIREEGIEERYDRHKRQAAMMDSAMEALGFSVAAEKGYRAPTLSVYKYPEGADIDDAKFRSILGEEGVESAGCLGEFKGIAFRMGHMGNIDKHTLVSAIAAVERTCMKCGLDIEPGSGVAVLQKGLVKE
jgi:aspartate aminotransferase-like enzyme